MKKTTMLFLALLLCFAVLGGCGGDGGSPVSEESPSPSPEENPMEALAGKYLYLFHDNEKFTLYEDGNFIQEDGNGTWTVDGQVVTLTYNDESKEDVTLMRHGDYLVDETYVMTCVEGEITESGLFDAKFTYEFYYNGALYTTSHKEFSADGKVKSYVVSSSSDSNPVIVEYTRDGDLIHTTTADGDPRVYLIYEGAVTDSAYYKS